MYSVALSTQLGVQPTLKPLGTKKAHQMPGEPQQHIVEVTHRNATREVERYIYGERTTAVVPITVMGDAGAGYQGVSCMQLGGVRTVEGTSVDVDVAQVIFTLPQAARPNHCTASVRGHR